GHAVRVVANKSQRLAHYIAHTPLVNVTHGENVDAGFLDQAAFLRIEIPHTDEDHVARLDFWLVAEQLDEFRRTITYDGRERHPVNVARRRTIRCVHVA